MDGKASPAASDTSRVPLLIATSDEIARTTYRALLDWQRATGRQILATA